MAPRTTTTLRTANRALVVIVDCVFGGEDLTVVAVEDGKVAAMAIHQQLMGDLA